MWVFIEYLLGLCADLLGLLFEHAAGRELIVEAKAAEISTVRAIPLGFILNELVTNSAKYGDGNVTQPSGEYSLSVLDRGEGFPAEFRPAASKGLGMKIVLALVRQIGGELRLWPADDGRRHFLGVTFAAGA